MIKHIFVIAIFGWCATAQQQSDISSSLVRLKLELMPNKQFDFLIDSAYNENSFVQQYFDKITFTFDNITKLIKESNCTWKQLEKVIFDGIQPANWKQPAEIFGGAEQPFAWQMLKGFFQNDFIKFNAGFIKNDFVKFMQHLQVPGEKVKRAFNNLFNVKGLFNLHPFPNVNDYIKSLQAIGIVISSNEILTNDNVVLKIHQMLKQYTSIKAVSLSDNSVHDITEILHDGKPFITLQYENPIETVPIKLAVRVNNSTFSNCTYIRFHNSSINAVAASVQLKSNELFVNDDDYDNIAGAPLICDGKLYGLVSKQIMNNTLVFQPFSTYFDFEKLKNIFDDFVLTTRDVIWQVLGVFIENINIYLRNNN